MYERATLPLTPSNYLQLMTIGQWRADGDSYVSGTDPSSVAGGLITDALSQDIMYGATIIDRFDAALTTRPPSKTMMEDWRDNPIAAAEKWGTPLDATTTAQPKRSTAAEMMERAVKIAETIAGPLSPTTMAKKIADGPDEAKKSVSNGVIIVVAIILLGIAGASIVIPVKKQLTSLGG